jgi:adenosylcobinamide-GDP ribazoletransferase
MQGLIGKPVFSMRYLQLFFLALSFYTRLPCPKCQDYSQLSNAGVFLTLIGWIVGGLTGLCFYWADYLWPHSVAVILSTVFGILLTGAFHEDGFADVCDGFGGGYDKQRILEIMKDPQVGVYGALGIVLLMSLKISLLNSFPAAYMPYLLIAGHSISRLQPLLIMRRYDYARTDNSKSQSAVFRPSVQALLFAVSVSLIPLLFLPVLFGLTIFPVLIVNWNLSSYFYSHIGGYTGDCLGASQQIAEVVFYLGISALWIFT